MLYLQHGRRDVKYKPSIQLYINYIEAQAIVFPLQPYRSETWHISLFRERLGRTNDINTIEYAPFRHDTAEVENRLI